MKYNININQFVLSKTSLDIIDCSILNYIYFYCSSPNKKIEKQRKREENGDCWTWIDFGTLLNDMPLLRIKSKGALTPRIKKIENEGYITTRRDSNQKLFIKLNEKIDELFTDMNGKADELFTDMNGSYSRKRTNNNTIDNNTNNNNYTNNICKQVCEIDKTQELLRLFYENLNPNIKFQNKTLRADAEFLVNHYDFDKLEAMILYIKEHQGEQYFPTITTPTQLRDKMASIINHRNREIKGSKIIKI